MCFTKLRVEVEQWEDEGVFLVSRLSVESVPAGDVVQEERDEEETCIDRMRTMIEFSHQVDVGECVECREENVEN